MAHYLILRFEMRGWLAKEMGVVSTMSGVGCLITLPPYCRTVSKRIFFIKSLSCAGKARTLADRRLVNLELSQPKCELCHTPITARINCQLGSH